MSVEDEQSKREVLRQTIILGSRRPVDTSFVDKLTGPSLDKALEIFGFIQGVNGLDAVKSFAQKLNLSLGTNVRIEDL